MSWSPEHQSVVVATTALYRICKRLPDTRLDFHNASHVAMVSSALAHLVASGEAYGAYLDLSSPEVVAIIIQPFFPLRRDRVRLPWMITIESLEADFPDLVVMGVMIS